MKELSPHIISSYLVVVGLRVKLHSKKIKNYYQAQTKKEESKLVEKEI